jgi:hypothetical protein
MTTPAAPSNSQPTGDEPNVVVVDENYAASTFEEKLERFWDKNRSAILGACIAVLVAILAVGVWRLYQSSQEKGIENDYAAATTPEKLTAFAAAHPDHSLAGLALLRLADDAYTAGKFADAQAGYEKAATALKSGPFAARAQLGAAMSKLGAGKAAEGEAALKQISDDASQFKGVRSEATYHLAKLASDAGRVADVTKLSDQLMQADPSSPWAQRAFMLRASLPAPAAPAAEANKGAAPAAAPTMPAITLPGAAK